MAHPKEFAEGLSIGIIMDGNGRWAKQRGLPRKMGHAAGGVQSGSDLEEIQHHQCAGYAAVSEGIGGNQSRHENGV